MMKEVRKSFRKEVKHSILDTVKYENVRTLKSDEEFKDFAEPAEVQVVCEDSVDAGFALQKEGFNPLILNMASERKPGGGWRNGKTAQEESLFYRSTYHLALEDPLSENPQSGDYYPLSVYSAIYTPDVYFFRDSDYKQLSYGDCRFLSCVAMAAIRHPKLDGGKYKESDRKKMERKIKGIFKIALKHGHDSVVLGAFGCGVFRNPPEEVAQIFSDVITQCRHSFKRITFAILGDDNFSTFKKVLTK